MYPMRKNGFTLLKRVDGFKTKKDEEDDDRFVES
jgi:hypothetical protein